MNTKPMTYGDSTAIMILAAERMGLNPSCVEDATRILQGLPVHVMHGAAVSAEAVRINNELRHNAAKITEANQHAEAVKIEYGFLPAPVSDSAPAKQENPAPHATAKVQFLGDKDHEPFEHTHVISLADVETYHGIRLASITENERLGHIEDYVLYWYYRRHGNYCQLRVDVDLPLETSGAADPDTTICVCYGDTVESFPDLEKATAGIQKRLPTIPDDVFEERDSDCKEIARFFVEIEEGLVRLVPQCNGQRQAPATAQTTESRAK